MPCDMDGRRIMVTNGDIGGEEGGIWHFCGDVFFEGPLKNI